MPICGRCLTRAAVHQLHERGEISVEERDRHLAELTACDRLGGTCVHVFGVEFPTRLVAALVAAMTFTVALAWNSAFTAFFDANPELKDTGPWVYALSMTVILALATTIGGHVRAAIAGAQRADAARVLRSGGAAAARLQRTLALRNLALLDRGGASVDEYRATRDDMIAAMA